MKRTMQKAVNLIVLFFVLFAIVVPLLYTTAETASAADQTGWDASLPYYWVPADPASEVTEALKSGKNSFFVTPGSCHPTLEEWGFGNGRRVYKEDLCPGQVFRVWGVTTDFKWVVGSRDGIGQRYFFPTYRLTTWIRTMPTGTSTETDCTGLKKDVSFNAVPSVNKNVRIGAGTGKDKLPVQVKGGAKLLSAPDFSDRRVRICALEFVEGEWFTVFYTLNHPVTKEPEWAYGQVIRGGQKLEGLVPTYLLTVPGQPAATSTTATTSSSTGVVVPTNVSSAPTAAIGTQTTTASPAPTKIYKVQKGDTLSKIAKDQGTTVAKIVAANSTLIKDPGKISVGWTLTVPVAP